MANTTGLIELQNTLSLTEADYTVKFSSRGQAFISISVVNDTVRYYTTATDFVTVYSNDLWGDQEYRKILLTDTVQDTDDVMNNFIGANVSGFTELDSLNIIYAGEYEALATIDEWVLTSFATIPLYFSYWDSGSGGVESSTFMYVDPEVVAIAYSYSEELGQYEFVYTGSWSDGANRHIIIAGDQVIEDADNFGFLSTNYQPYTPPVVTYTVTYNLTNCTGWGTNPTEVETEYEYNLKFTANDGYELPSSITVTGATLVSWTKSTGTAVIGSITGNVTVTVAATAVTYTIAAGTYKCAESPSAPTAAGTLYSNIAFKCGVISYVEMSIYKSADDDVIINYYTSDTSLQTAYNNGWTNDNYKTIVIDSPQTVTDESFYNWFTANFTKTKTIRTLTINGAVTTTWGGKPINQVTVDGVTYVMP